MKTFKIFIVLTVLLFAFTTMAFSADVVKIGLFVPLTGFAAADGASAKHAALLAVERINKEGGINGKKLELVIYDDRVKSQEAVAIARKLVEQDKVIGVVSGSYSTPTRAAAPIYQRYGIPMIAAYATHPDITKAGNFIFRAGFLAAVEGRAGGYVATKLLGAKKIAVLTMDNDFGRALSAGFVKEAKKNGAEIVANLSFALGEKDFSPMLTKIKGLAPDVLYSTGYYSEGALVVKQAKDLGLNVKIVGQEGFDSPMFLKIAGDAANGVIITTDLNRDDKRDLVKWFIKEYTDRYKMDPDMVGASTFDAVYILASAIKKAGENPKKIRDAIAQTKDFNGLTGVIKGFNKLGEVVKDVQVQEVKNGKFTYFSVISDPEIITPPEK